MTRQLYMWPPGPDVYSPMRLSSLMDLVNQSPATPKRTSWDEAVVGHGSVRAEDWFLGNSVPLSEQSQLRRLMLSVSKYRNLSKALNT